MGYGNACSDPVISKKKIARGEKKEICMCFRLLSIRKMEK